MIKQHDDPHYIVKLEKAIAEKYGEEAIQNPKAEWDENKEKVYLEQMRELYKKQKKTINDWQELGIRLDDGRDLPRSNILASIIIVMNKKTEKRGKAYLVYNNFNVTLKWNRSIFFAVAIGTLADQIAYSK